MEEISELKRLSYDAVTDFGLLFLLPEKGTLRFAETDRRSFLEKYFFTLKAVQRDLDTLSADHASSRRYTEKIDDIPDSVDCLNDLASFCRDIGFTGHLEAAVFDVLTARGYFTEHAEARKLARDGDFRFLLEHVSRLFRVSRFLFSAYPALLEEKSPGRSSGLSRVSPAAASMRVGRNSFDFARRGAGEAAIAKLMDRAALSDPFKTGRAFRCIDGVFLPAELNSVRKVGDFYGYPGARRVFGDYFRTFSKGGANLPLLISSLPGLGKTHFTISFALSFENLVLILPEPSDLEKPLEGLIRRLARRKNRRFVLFFDDVDTGRVDWYYFRTNIGGSFVLPDNITVVIASNYEFPANISSRGRGFIFPMFDEIRCQEMVRDFLISLGMRNPSPELVSVIAADYVEEFGQRMFEELSPRTLVRYLERYERDAEKRKRMLDLSREDVVTRPDSQVFYDFNIRLLRGFHGEAAIERLRMSETDEFDGV